MRHSLKRVGVTALSSHGSITLGGAKGKPDKQDEEREEGKQSPYLWISTHTEEYTWLWALLLYEEGLWGKGSRELVTGSKQTLCG
jgi:hypothetical protein